MPAVSIIIPLFNDEEWVGRSIESCLAQSSGDFEVICVDDASTDRTTAVVSTYAARDPRIRLIRQPENQSAYQARKRGVEAATGRYVLFLDGDDELAPTAVARTLEAATATGADVLGFGVEVRTPDGRGAPRFERSLQPPLATLEGAGILETILPPGQPAQGHIWRYLWATTLLRSAYASAPAHHRLYRANDLPITFLALALATRFSAISDKLYRYDFGRGTSGQDVADVERFRFFLSALDSIDAIESSVHVLADSAATGSVVQASYASARRSIIANVLRNLVERTDSALRDECLTLVRQRVADDAELVAACAAFFPAALDMLAERMATEPVPRRPVRRVLITTGNLRAGGVQGVVAAQARELVRAGFEVCVVTFTDDASVYELPQGVDVEHITGTDEALRLDAWRRILRDRAIDVVLDHHILYNRRWPFTVLTARASGVPTIGWLHNFALRAMADGTDGVSFLQRYLPLLQTVVVLSETDVAFWRALEVPHVVYLPNPLSEITVAHARQPRRRAAGPLQLAWWGRLQQSTKQVRDLIEVAARLEQRGVDFHLTIVGPDTPDLTAEQLRDAAAERGLCHRVTLTGALQGQALTDVIDQAHLAVATSVIEGYPLTLVEAQSRGLGVVMYDLPWLAVAEDNAGIIMVAQGAKDEMAQVIEQLADDDAALFALTTASAQAAERALSHDFADLYTRLFAGALDMSGSRELDPQQLALLLRLSVLFSERNARVSSRARDALSKAHRATGRAQRRLRYVESGPSYRIGRVLTFVPRKIRDLLRR